MTALIESPPIQGLPENISELLDLLVACAKPASGQNSARVAAGLVRDYIADLIRERDEARAAQSSLPAGEIQGLVERAMALANAETEPTKVWAAIAKDRADWLVDAVATATQDRRFLRGEDVEDEAATEAIILNGEKAILVAIQRAHNASRQLIPELCEAITRLSQPSGEVRNPVILPLLPPPSEIK